MTDINQILSETRHRPFDVPAGKWSYYQEWNNALFLHWQVPLELLRPLVPESLNIDVFEGNAYVSLVAFTMQKIRPRNLPALAFVSDFEEINLRTYIDHNNKKGVYFLNIEAEKQLSVFIARALSGLPYEKSNIRRTNEHYRSINTRKNYYLDAAYEVKASIFEKTALDHWLTERYCLYLNEGEVIYCYDIHHKAWELKKVALNALKVKYKLGRLSLNGQPQLMHYSEGVRVVAWKRNKL